MIRTSPSIDKIWTMVKLRKDIALSSVEIVEESEGRCYDVGNRLTEDLEEVIVTQTTTSFTNIASRIVANRKWRLHSRSNYDRFLVEEE